ncbi:unnamed protein product [Allacma fusca]|uniref:Uncharacterized protein n=1 Tax=Allacma fusca TaxID=39272 RepID=A0A8J2JS05_9HEXA|nr:unnamed protein product [Allacma fusca]
MYKPLQNHVLVLQQKDDIYPKHLSLNTIVDFKLLAHHTFSTTTIIQKKFPKTRNAYEVIIADPPFLSEGCLTKLEEAVRLLLTNSRFQNYLRTGAVMTENAEKLLSRKKNKFEPH